MLALRAMSADDEPVLSLLRSGNAREAAAALIRAEGPAVLRYLRAVLRDEDLANDAFSLFAEWSWSAIESYRGESTVRTWSFGIAVNAARRVRDEAWHKHKERLKTGDASRLAEEVRTSSPRELERQADRLAELRQELSAEDQNLLVLRLDQRLTWDEVAAILAEAGQSASPAGLRKRFERLKERIARLARTRGLLRR